MSTQQPGPANLVLGTAGHIDHGKSSLVKALTGIDPDRLAEEKRRGITIELGFAYLTLPSGRRLGVVDVPGHERFVRHMVAGASGVDMALLAIAADDGVMPQTIEHMAVLELLGVRKLVVALTKIDLVDEEWRTFIEDDIRERLASTPFAEAPVVPVSSRTGAGLDDLRQALDACAAHAERTKQDAPARMPVDRAFTVHGFGTVVTGTLWSGSLAEGDELILLPSEQPVRVRTLQIHGNAVAQAPAGNRVAVGLAGISLDEVRPGDFLTAPGATVLTDRFDAEFSYADPFGTNRPLKSGTRAHIAHGTREVIGRILAMDAEEELAPGRHLVQIRLDKPLPLAYQDRFVVRSYSPAHVIGGGTVLAAHPRRRTMLNAAEHRLLAALSDGDEAAALRAHLELADLPETASTAARACGLPEATTERLLTALADDASVAVLPGREATYVRPALLQQIMAVLDRTLLEFHSSNPQATGLPKEALRHRTMARADAALFDAILEEAVRRGCIVVNRGEVSHPKAGAGAQAAERNLAERILAVLTEEGTKPPELSAVAAAIDADTARIRRAAARLAEEGKLVRVETDRYYTAGAIEQLRKAATDLLRARGSASAADLKEAMGLSRKFAMPLLEFFDEEGLTHREGDLRTLAGPPRP